MKIINSIFNYLDGITAYLKHIILQELAASHYEGQDFFIPANTKVNAEANTAFNHLGVMLLGLRAAASQNNARDKQTRHAILYANAGKLSETLLKNETLEASDKEVYTAALLVAACALHLALDGDPNFMYQYPAAKKS